MKCCLCEDPGILQDRLLIYLCPWHAMSVADRLAFLARLEREGYYGPETEGKAQIARRLLLERKVPNGSGHDKRPPALEGQAEPTAQTEAVTVAHA